MDRRVPSCEAGSKAQIRRARASAVLFGVLSLLITAPAVAQAPSERMRAFAESLSGLSLIGNLEGGAMSTSGERTFTLDLRAGTDYLVAGFCDDGCTDLNLVVLDPTGQEVSADLLPDPEPVAAFVAETTGRFQLTAIMTACEAQACRFSVGVLSRSETGVLGVGRDMDQWVQSLRNELRTEGFVEVQERSRGSLGQGQEARFPISLEGGMEYRITGVCDQDCQDLDLTLFDSNDTVLDSDELPDAFPLLAFTPDSTGEFTVATSVRKCSIDPCSYLLVVFARRGQMDLDSMTLDPMISTGAMAFDTVFNGSLTGADPELQDGEYFDLYPVDAEAGQTMILDLRSEDFDTFLFLEAPGGETEENDDYGEVRGHSHIQAVVWTSGTYYVRVSSYGPGETGQYQLRVTVLER